MNALFHLDRGDAPLVVNVPHAGTFIPPDLAAGLTTQALAVPDTDWHVDRLWAQALDGMDVTQMRATHSRIVVDLNRDPSGAALYPGASNTEICPTSTFHEEPHYRPGQAPDAAAIAARIERCWRPYHAALATEIERVRARHGYCILLDGHSIISVAPRFFDGRLPDLNLGSADGASADSALAASAFAILAAEPGFSAVCNGRFKGGYITRHYGRPERGVHALQLETAQACYLDEARPAHYDAARAAPLVALLRRLALGLLGWRPRAALGGSEKKGEDAP